MTRDQGQKQKDTQTYSSSNCEVAADLQGVPAKLVFPRAALWLRDTAEPAGLHPGNVSLRLMVGGPRLACDVGVSLCCCWERLWNLQDLRQSGICHMNRRTHLGLNTDWPCAGLEVEPPAVIGESMGANETRRGFLNGVPVARSTPLDWPCERFNNLYKVGSRNKEIPGKESILNYSPLKHWPFRRANMQAWTWDSRCLDSLATPVSSVADPFYLILTFSTSLSQKFNPHRVNKLPS
jgi:hypothetical protein